MSFFDIVYEFYFIIKKGCQMLKSDRPNKLRVSDPILRSV